MNEFHEEDEDYFCRFSFGQFVSLALLEVIALFFVFYLGARYGSGMLGHTAKTDTDHLAVTEQALVEAEQTTPGKVKYTFPEELTRKPQQPVVPTPIAKKPAQPEPERTIVPKQVPTEQRRGYSIQVGSYRQPGGAAAKVNQWQAKGYDAFLSIGEVPNSGTWYRVRIGSFKTRESARVFLDELSKREKVAAIIVRSNS